MGTNLLNKDMPVLIVTACASQDEAIKIAQALVLSKLVACAQIHGDMTSIYEWGGKLETSREVPLHLKTINGHWEEIRKIIQSMHSYEVPEIIATPIIEISDEYSKWLIESVKKQIVA